VNPILSEYMTAEFFDEYQALREQLLEVVTDDDLRVSLGGTSLTLGALCREIGEIEHAYVDSFRVFRQDFTYRAADDQVESSVTALRTWYQELDQELAAVLEALSAEDMKRRIVRADLSEDDFSPTPIEQLDVYREALLIFYGKASAYLRALSKPFPEQWRTWIG
jgi:uncharacterized damage-inducible protein DinB